MRYEDFIKINKSRKASDSNNKLQKATIENFDKSDDICLVHDDQFYDWIAVNWIVQNVIINPLYYLTNPSEVKDWKGWTK